MSDLLRWGAAAAEMAAAAAEMAAALLAAETVEREKRMSLFLLPT